MEKLTDTIYYSKPTLAPLRASVAFIIGQRQNVLVDAGSTVNHAIKIQNEINELSSNPLTHIILTHSHYDHASGISYFKVETLVSEETKKLLEDKACLKVVSLPYELDLGNEKLLIDYVPTSHCQDHVLIYAKKAQVLFLGDAMQSHLFNKAFYFYEKETLKLIEKVKSYDYKYIHTGHQGILNKEQSIKYFEQMMESLSFVQSSSTLEKAKANYINKYSQEPKGLYKYFIEGFFRGKK